VFKIGPHVANSRDAIPERHKSRVHGEAGCAEFYAPCVAEAAHDRTPVSLAQLIGADADAREIGDGFHHITA
jgi:hypothetical protein